MPSSVRVLKLASGGSLTFVADINLFDLSPQDRELLTDLVDRLNAYESLHASKTCKLTLTQPTPDCAMWWMMSCRECLAPPQARGESDAG